ncbi:MAG: metal ABC transporter permease [Thermoplasmatales archaeon]|nr:metal ABC transporter permease [Thermoplasmatales archaeon]
MTDWGAVLSIPLIQNMFLATLAAAALCGVVGTLVVVKRIVFVSGGIAHTTFGGVGFAYWVQSTFLAFWFAPMLGAAIFGIAAAIILCIPSVSKRVREDSTIGVLWVVGMALGVIFMGLVDPASGVVPRSFESVLFGDVLLVSGGDLKIMVAVAVAVVAIIAFLYRDLQALTFDETHARLSGMNVLAMNVLLYVLIAVTCVLAMNVVGIILVIAMLTIPASIAGMVSDDLGETMAFSVAFAAVLSVVGLVAAIELDVSPGSSVTLCMGIAFIVAIAGKALASRLARPADA